MPATGLAIASRWALVIRGKTKPLVVEDNSSKLEAPGLVVPMPTFVILIASVVVVEFIDPTLFTSNTRVPFQKVASMAPIHAETPLPE
jgi:hypothetical protein